jgi:nitrogen fixation/metabolism regulation signal transduction histidine kinase
MLLAQNIIGCKFNFSLSYSSSQKLVIGPNGETYFIIMVSFAGALGLILIIIIIVCIVRCCKKNKNEKQAVAPYQPKKELAAPVNPSF